MRAGQTFHLHATDDARVYHVSRRATLGLIELAMSLVLIWTSYFTVLYFQTTDASNTVVNGIQIAFATLTIFVTLASKVASWALRRLFHAIARSSNFGFVLFPVCGVSRPTIDGLEFTVWQGNADYLAIQRAAVPGRYEVSLTPDLSQQRMISIKAFEPSG